MARSDRTEIVIDAGVARLEGTLTMPEGGYGLVVFAHGSGSSRQSPRNRQVAEFLNARGLGTLLFDLLTPEEEAIDAQTAKLRFDIGLLARRLIGTVDWLVRQPRTIGMRIGLFGASTGAAGALITAAQRPAEVHAVVSRGGRPDLAHDALPLVLAPTLLIVGGHDTPVIPLNERAAARIKATTRLEVVPGATHLFEEPGTLETVARLASDWFATYLHPEQIRPFSGSVGSIARHL